MDWTRVAKAGFGDMESHFPRLQAEGEGAGACAGGGVLPVGSGGAHFHAQRSHWNQTLVWECGKGNASPD